MAPYRSGAEATVRLSCSNPTGVVYLSYAPLRSSTPVGEAARRSTQRLGMLTNNSGGVQGGISNGEDIVFRVAFK